ncbi:hypothetical protein K1T71_013270 [Dendrolimus kikuchii]|uniref:Uncharacterized protein n=1 Tax=Dendrolimus kikuchii TaxID=765133 RepID=A0ACC1CHL9_9NEOP|nr:hypothetical protein K1T71_013270 [Dendrolimus kikuchii]
MDKVSNNALEPTRPLPCDFDTYLPWACQQLGLNATVIVERVIQNEYVSAVQTDRSKTKNKAKAVQSRTEVTSDQDRDDSRLQLYEYNANIIKIFAVYNNNGDLVEIKFDRNRQILRVVFKIINLIIQFHPHLTSITINRGLDKYILYELCKCLTLSNVTEVCLDNTFVPEANYNILLENQSTLKHLSLARCRIADLVVNNIAAMLVYPLPASKTLRTLNLSSNKISDEGAKSLGNILRSNRTLCYLNLADNRITDDGASSILNNLQQFPMTYDEVMSGRTRYMIFLKEKRELIKKIVIDLKAGDFDKKPKRKPTRPTTASSGKKGKVEKETSLRGFPEMDGKSLVNMEMVYLDKAEVIADDMLGEFVDPFCLSNTIVTDGISYCCGNNTLCCLNLAYNDVSFFTVKQLLSVVYDQKLLDRKPRGLINVNIEGNNIPLSCKELAHLDNLLEMGLMVHSKRMSVVKKKPAVKTGK